MATPLAAELARQARRAPTSVAVACESGLITARALQVAGAAVAAFCRANGVQRIVVVCDDPRGAATAMVGAAMGELDIVFVPTIAGAAFWHLWGAWLTEALPSVVFTDRRDLGSLPVGSHVPVLEYDSLLRTGLTVAEPKVEVPGRRPSIGFFSSGSTGVPRLILHDESSVLAGARMTDQLMRPLDPRSRQFVRGLHGRLGTRAMVRCGRRPVWMSLLPTWTIGSYAILIKALLKHDPYVGMTRFRPRAALDLASRYRVTTLAATPVAAERVGRTAGAIGWHSRDLAIVNISGESIALPKLLHVEEALGACAFVTYGLTETCGPVLSDVLAADGARVSGGIGRSFPGVDVRVDADRDGAVGVDDSERGHDRVGTLALRSPSLMKAVSTAPGELEPMSPGQWFVTGDRVRLDPEGRVSFVGRNDNVFIADGRKISAETIEDVVGQLLDLSCCAVEAELGGKKRIVCLLEGQLDRAEIDVVQACRSGEGESFRLDRVLPVARLPRLATGKVDRASARQLAERSLVGHGRA